MNNLITHNSYKFPGMMVWLFLGMVMLNSGRTVAQNWNSFGNGGMTDWVFATAMYNGDLIAGGKFTSAGGVSANHIARWDGSQWLPLGLGVNGKVNALVEYNGNLIVGGEFTEAGGQTVDGVAQWDGSNWSPMGGGFFYNGSNVYGVHSLTNYGTELIAGGIFSAAGGASASHIASWYEPSIGMNQLPDVDLFQVFPNPTNDNITLSGLPSETNLKFTIKDLSGRALQQGILTQEETGINLDKLSAGSYFISIQSTDLQTFKIVKR